MDYFSIDGTENECFVLFHGTGGNEYSLIQIAGDLNAHASILSFVGDVGTGEARRFFKPLVQGQLERDDFDARVTQFLQQWPSIKPDKKLTFIGFSNGANFILGLLEKQPDIAERVVLLHPSNLGYQFEAGSDAHIIITTGALDMLAPAGEVLKLAKQLEEHFAHVTFKLLDGQHQVKDAEIDYVKAVLHQA